VFLGNEDDEQLQLTPLHARCAIPCVLKTAALSSPLSTRVSPTPPPRRLIQEHGRRRKKHCYLWIWKRRVSYRTCWRGISAGHRVPCRADDKMPSMDSHGGVTLETHGMQLWFEVALSRRGNFVKNGVERFCW